MPLSPGTVVERYIIEGVIGEGAMAIVYRARHRDLGSLHAIKQLTHHDPQISDRLVQEGRLQSTLNHPNVLSVTDLVYIHETPALVMEYVAGPTLRQLMSEETLDLKQADALVQGLLRGVAAAHTHGLVHRDLKPANILIAVTDSGLVPKVADFGLAKVLERGESDMSATQSGSAMGTPAYMAPEQIQDSSSVDARADVFALGAILYELVSGRRCFEGDRLLDLWQDICAGHFTPLRETRPELPERIVNAVNGALVVDRDARIESVNSLIDVWFEGVTESVDFSPSKSQEVWPQALREKTVALASDVIIPDESPDGSLGLEQTLAAPSLPEVPGAKPTSATLSPSARLERPDWPEHLPPHSGGLPMWVYVIGILFLASTAWVLGRQTSLSEPSANSHLHNNEAHSAAASTADAQAPDTREAPSEFLRLAVEDAGAQRRLRAARAALFDGETARAGDLLRTLKRRHPDEPIIGMLLSLTYYLQGHVALSMREASRGASLAQDGQPDLKLLLELTSQSWREPTRNNDLLRRWSELLERHDTPVASVLYLTAARHLIGYPTLKSALDKRMKEHPDWVILRMIELRMLEERKDLDALLEAATVASVAHPASPELKVKRFSAMAQLGQLEASEIGLKDVLREEGDLTAARIVLADIYLRQDREAERLEQFVMLLSDTTPKIDQVNFLAAHGQRHADLGRLIDADKLWRFCVDEASRAELYHSAAICTKSAVDAYRALELPLAPSGWLERTRDLLSQRDLDADTRELHSLNVLWQQAQERLDATPPEPAEAEVLLTRIGAYGEGDLPVASKLWFTRELTWSLALVEQNPATLKRLLAEAKTRQAVQRREPCGLEAKRAKAAVVLKDKTMYSDALNALINETCLRGLYHGITRTKARVSLAKLLLEEGQPDAALEQLEAVRSEWPRPDQSLPVMQRLEALEGGR